MKRVVIVLMALLMVDSVAAAIRRDPNGVNVNSHGATTVFITFGGLVNQVPVEAFWCGELIAASPDVGQKCRADTIFGRLPLRYDRSSIRGGVVTDIMSIPQTVSRRAYEAALGGQTSSFFYVRRFVSTAGGPDEYVFVTCRMAGTGARVPLALTDVQLRFELESPMLPVRPGEAPPQFHAELQYNGTGQLRGRWEVVVPGDEPPSSDDLLTEASLPLELRSGQRRYPQLERFHVFLPPTGRHRLMGPDPSKLPTQVEGPYQILLRVEASDDKEADSNLALAGAGRGIVHSGGVAGFPMPVLRYYVGHAGEVIAPGEALDLALVSPAASAQARTDQPLEFRASSRIAAPYYRLDVRDAARNVVLSAVLRAEPLRYTAPPWFRERTAAGRLQWRVIALSSDGKSVMSTPWRDLHWIAPPP